jgi:hypothetical protein
MQFDWSQRSFGSWCLRCSPEDIRKHSSLIMTWLTLTRTSGSVCQQFGVAVVFFVGDEDKSAERPKEFSYQHTCSLAYIVR